MLTHGESVFQTNSPIIGNMIVIFLVQIHEIFHFLSCLKNLSNMANIRSKNILHDYLRVNPI